MSKHSDVDVLMLSLKSYLENRTYVGNLSTNDKRNIRKRAKDFKIENGELYFVQTILCNGKNDDDGQEFEQLRKAVMTESEKYDIVSKLHMDENGAHLGIEKTSKAIQVQFYWVGIIEFVKKFIRECKVCTAQKIEMNNFHGISSKESKNLIWNGTEVEEDDGASSLQDSMKIDAEVPVEDFRNDVEDCFDQENVDDQPVVAVGNENLHFVIKGEIMVDNDTEQPSEFWQLVEFQYFGPFKCGASEMYICVGIDVFSRWTEVKIFQQPSLTSFMNYILQLMCRYGKMKTIHLKDDAVLGTKQEDLIPAIYRTFGGDVMYRTSSSIQLETFWMAVRESFHENISKHPDDWINCLELYLYPFRFYCSEGSEYTPAYLTFSREPNHLQTLQRKKDGDLEIIGTSQQRKDTSTDKLMNMYQEINVDEPLTEITAIKRESNTSVTVVNQITSNSELSDRKDSSDSNHDSASIEKKTTKSNKASSSNICTTRRPQTRNSARLSLVKDDPDFTPTMKCAEVNAKSGDTGVQLRDEVLKVELPGEGRRRSLRGVKQDWTSLCTKRKRVKAEDDKTAEKQEASKKWKKEKNSRSIEHEVSDESEEVEDDYDDDYKVDNDEDSQIEGDEDVGDRDMNISVEENDSMYNSKSFDADEYYRAVKHYLETKQHKTQSSANMKKFVNKSFANFSVEDGNLYYQPGNKYRKRIVMDEKERLELMSSAHIDDEGTHLCKRKVIDCISAMDNYWRGMTLDCEAFVRVCPECSKGDLRKKSTEKSPDVSKDLTPQKKDAKAETDCKTIKDFLKDKVYPPNYDRLKKASLRRRALNYFLKDDKLYYRFYNSPKSKPRLCLFTSEEKCNAIREAHIDKKSANHLGLNRTQDIVKEKYYWVGQTYDIHDYIRNCCTDPEKQSTDCIDKKTVIQEREEKFRQYIKSGILKYIKQEKPKPMETKPGPSTNKEIGSKSDLEISSSSTQTTPQGSLAQTEQTKSQHNEENTEEDNQCNISSQETDKAIEGIGSQSSSNPEETASSSTQIDNVAAEETSTSNQDDGQTTIKEKTAAKKEKTFKDKNGRKSWLQCSECKALFSGKVAYKIHMMKHEGIKPYKCDFCEKGFSTVKAKMLHRRKHTGEQPYLCNICGRGFERRNGLHYHLKAHERGGGLPVVCPICKRTFQTASRLVQHSRCKHPAVQPTFNCEHCTKVFSSKRSLKRHISSTHLQEKKYQCQWCLRAFARNEYLVKHLANQHGNHPLSLTQTQIKEEPTQETILQYIDASTLEQLTANGTVALDSNVQYITHSVVEEAPLENSDSTTVVLTEGAVQYEIECLTTDQPSLSVDEQKAIQLLLQASLQGQDFTTTQHQ